MDSETPHELVPSNTIGPAGPCPNCGAEKLGSYCFQCGQRHASRVSPLKQLFEEALDNVFSLDNKLWRTLKALVRQPADLTTAYLAGQRARYMSPFRLYLICSVLYFLIASLVGTTDFLFYELRGDDTGEFGRVLPKMMFVIVPAFALLLHALYRRPQRLYATHLIFSLHVHAIWYLLFAIVALVEPLVIHLDGDGSVTAMSVVATVVSSAAELAIIGYLYIAMRSMYGQSKPRTLMKLVLLIAGYLVVLLVFMLVYFLATRWLA